MKKLLLISLIFLLPNFAFAAVTWNPADKDAGITLSNGNLTATNSSGTWPNVRATVSKTTGKWYWEVHGDLDASSLRTGFAGTGAMSNPFDNGSNGWGYGGDGRGDCITGGTITLIGSANFGTGDTAMFAYDADAGKLWVGQNGTWLNSGNPAAGTGQIWTVTANTQLFPVFSGSASTDAVTADFGATAFAFTPPSGFSGLDSAPAAVTLTSIISLLHPSWVW